MADLHFCIKSTLSQRDIDVNSLRGPTFFNCTKMTQRTSSIDADHRRVHISHQNNGLGEILAKVVAH